MHVDPFGHFVRRVNEDMKKVANTNQSSWMKPFEQFYAVKSKHSNLPYNILRTDTGFLVEMAVAGFDMNDIKITSSLNWVVVSGIRSCDDHGKDDYVHRGIAFRDFSQEFKTVDNIEFVSASLKNGLLSVKIDVTNPKSAKVQTVQINQE